MEIRPTYLIMVTSNNNNKYYNLFPDGDRLRVEYGRVDATKTTTYYPISKFESQVKSKLKKGYIEDGKVIIQMDEMVKFDKKPYVDVTFARFRISRDIWENMENVDKVEFVDIFEKKVNEEAEDMEAETSEETVPEVSKETEKSTEETEVSKEESETVPEEVLEERIKDKK